MKILVKRIAKRPTYTIGKMYLDGKYFCDTLEDTDRNISQSTPLDTIKKVKLPNNTAIPTGTYKVIVNVSPKFKRLLPRLLNVPGFDGILIHCGNSQYDTNGCILVGQNKLKGKVVNSQVTFTALYNQLKTAKNNKESITLTIE